MRILALTTLCLLAACSGGGADEKEQAPAESLDAGLWDASFETTAFRSTDNTTPAVKAAVGDKSATQACLAEADKASPPTSLFGGEGYECAYKTSYMSSGRLNHSLECSRDGVTGSIPMLVEGSFTATSFEATVTTQTYLPGSGDYYMQRKVSGRRTAPSCPPGLDEGKEKAKA
jgi:hypothetical protein